MNCADRFAAWVSAEAQDQFRLEIAEPEPPADLAAIRAHYDAYNRRRLAVALDHYPVDVAEEDWRGVPVQVVTPRGGARDARTLICLHGGAFMWGSGAGALLEAAPVAASTGMRVVAVDYRLAPEHIFPAAVEDVVAVYMQLIEQQTAASVGVFGCSAGGALTAQTIARLIADGRATPGAIAMLHGTGLKMDGDSAWGARHFDPRPHPAEPPRLADLPYFTNADLGDPRVLPGHHPRTLALFPPSLLISGSRDFAASACSVMHRRLIAAGVDARFVQFEGMWHAHHMAVALPESRETFALLSGFFEKFLSCA